MDAATLPPAPTTPPPATHLLLVVLVGCGGQPTATTTTSTATADDTRPAPPTALVVPLGDTPVIDGTAGDAEWSRARAVELDRGVQLRVVHDGASVHVAIIPPAGDGMAFGCIFVSDGDEVAILHASAQLGTAVYARAADGTYSPRSKSYEWRDAAAMLATEGWLASTVGPKPQHQEFTLTFPRLGLPDAHPVALGYIIIPPDTPDLTTASTVTWPSNLADAAADPEVLGGFNPDRIRFAPSTWAEIRLAP